MYDNLLLTNTLPNQDAIRLSNAGAIGDGSIQASKIADLQVNTITVSDTGYIRSGKDSFTDSTNAGWILSPLGIYSGSASDAAYLKYSVGGTLVIKGALTTNADSVINGTYIDSLAVSKLTTGTISSQAITLGITGGTGDAKIQAGKTDFTNTETGFILGMDDSDFDKTKFYIGNSSTYINWDGTNIIIKAGSGSSIDFSYVSGATKPADNATVGATIGSNLSGGSTSANYINSSGYVTAITATSITTGTLTVGSSKVGITVESGGDIVMESTSSSSISEIIFNRAGTANKGWNIWFTADGGGGVYNAGDLQFLSQSSNDSDNVRFGIASAPCNVIIHGTTFASGKLKIPVGTDLY